MKVNYGLWFTLSLRNNVHVSALDAYFNVIKENIDVIKFAKMFLQISNVWLWIRVKFNIQYHEVNCFWNNVTFPCEAWNVISDALILSYRKLPLLRNWAYQKQYISYKDLTGDKLQNKLFEKNTMIKIHVHINLIMET